MARSEQTQMETSHETRTIISLGHIWVVAQARTDPNLLPQPARKARKTPSKALFLVEETHGCQISVPNSHPTPTPPLRRQSLRHPTLQEELKLSNLRIQLHSAHQLPLLFRSPENRTTHQMYHHKLLQSPVILLSCKVRFGGCRLVVEQL